MTLSALVMMFSAWFFIGYYTIRFFLKVLKSPHLAEHTEQPEITEK